MKRGGGGGGGGRLPVLIIDKKNDNEKIEETSKEKHSPTRKLKLVGYRNWRQRWFKTEGNKVFEKRVNETNILYLARVNVTEKKC